ncbi:MAG: preprotein translocase subunit SecE [Acidimicrobiia bacterium]|nr:preprotein translocase subunit SecE [Acidimicrobiia bacterium]MBT8216244.1 preprotein translocase subunit SecE [Acidimicrobiia bacterium]NNF09694.1 preprotein translocase subunit SecE [Acidimicrobiia bacterium]NNL68821.1 preprotein translocase subunit SecE [Acidimicrobiia bacterium]
MNRELRRQQARQERLDKKQGKPGRQAAAQRAAGKAVGEGKERRGLRTYLHEVRQELSKVAWPDRQTLTTYTAVSLIATIALTAYTAGLDFIFKQAFVDLILQ